MAGKKKRLAGGNGDKDTCGGKQMREFCNRTGKSQTESGGNGKTEGEDVWMVSGNSAVGEKEIK